jgi:hypothetical protein
MTEGGVILGELAIISWSEAEASGVDPALGIAHCLRNRIEAGWYGGDWFELFQNLANSSANEILLARRYPDFRDLAIVKWYMPKVEQVFQGTLPDMTFGAKYWGKLGTARQWFVESIVRSSDHKRTAQIGEFSFYS